MTTTAIQRAVRPIIFDDAHLGAIISDFRYVGSKHNVVIDGHAGEKSLTINLANTPEVRALIFAWLAEAEVSSEDVLVIGARDSDNARRRLVLSLAKS
jgi:hypothetical protein